MYIEEKTNARILNDYLAGRHKDPKQETILEEYSCHDCRTNIAIELIAKYEQQRTRKFNFVSPKLRKLMSAGLTFTKNSVMFDAHKNHKNDIGHNWFLTQPKVEIEIKTF